ncbi:MAG TPA: glycoside hydrolase family 3 N-terminal domain-containing protein [Gemmatimonadaceae bacterium]|nr:glycoside hydrolase family 3 N-terminal domain-containing protein [Gemmatimonadaceae bacterium]
MRLVQTIVIWVLLTLVVYSPAGAQNQKPKSRSGFQLSSKPEWSLDLRAAFPTGPLNVVGAAILKNRIVVVDGALHRLLFYSADRLLLRVDTLESASSRSLHISALQRVIGDTVAIMGSAEGWILAPDDTTPSGFLFAGLPARPGGNITTLFAVLPDGSSLWSVLNLGMQLHPPAKRFTDSVDLFLQTPNRELKLVRRVPAMMLGTDSSGHARQMWFYPHLVWAAINGHFYYGFGTDYRMVVLDPHTGKEISWIRAWTRQKVRKADIDEFIRGWSANWNKGADSIAVKTEMQNAPFAEFVPAFSQFLVSAREELWVRSANLIDAQGAGELNSIPLSSSKWSVFDKTGRWLTDVSLPSAFQPMDIGSDYILGVQYDLKNGTSVGSARRLVLYRYSRGLQHPDRPENTLSAQQLPYRDARISVDARVRDLFGRMTLEEKFWQLFMIPGDLDDSTNDYHNGIFGLQVRGPVTARAHAEKINSIQRYFVEKTRLGIPMIPFEETVHGLLANNATVFPAAIALAATWDTSLVGRVGTAIAREASSRGIRQGLSPVINIATDPRWGRTEETYGEDPLLSSRIGVAFVRGFEQNGVIATPKHFVANVGEGGRDSYPIEVSRRVLEEIHFPPFIAAIQEGGARSIMTAYNSVDGVPATQNSELLNNTLKHDWKFTGFVISDQAATGGATVLHNTEASTATATKNALDAGLDVIFQSSWPQHRPYLAAFKSGAIADSVIDAAVSHVLRAKFELGLFERPFMNPDSAAYWNDNAAQRALARNASRESIVLLRNEQQVLPLSASLKSIALIGEDAAEPRFGGYSGVPSRAVSVLEGIRARAITVRYAKGPGRLSPEFTVVPGDRLSNLRGEYFDNPWLQGDPKLVRSDKKIDFGWSFNSPGRDIPRDWFSVRWSGRITAPNAGVHRLGVEGNDGYRLYVDSRLVIDNWKKQGFRTSLADVHFTPGSTHDIRLEYFETTGNVKLKLVWDAGVPTNWRAQIDSAAAIARESSVAIVVAGIEEGEFRDRARLSLPGHQEELIERVAATGTPTIVVLIGGSAVTGNTWIDHVSGLLTAWYPGEEGGNAIADILFGDYNPAGRLPMTWPIFEGQLPLVYNHKPTGRGDDYSDLTGQPLFPFGFGLSYTTFDYSDLTFSKQTITATDSTVVRFKVRNTGKRAGDEVIQLYVRDLLASVARPVMQLEGFQRVTLKPGEEKQVSFTLGGDQLRMLDKDLHWVVEPGTFRVLIGSSAKDIRIRGDLDVR